MKIEMTISSSKRGSTILRAVVEVTMEVMKAARTTVRTKTMILISLKKTAFLRRGRIFVDLEHIWIPNCIDWLLLPNLLHL